jgi:hypothetical protein
MSTEATNPIPEPAKKETFRWDEAAQETARLERDAQATKSAAAAEEKKPAAKPKK